MNITKKMKLCMALLLVATMTLANFNTVFATSETVDPYCGKETIRHWMTASTAIINYRRDRDLRSITAEDSPGRSLIFGVALAQSWDIHNADDLRRQVTRLTTTGGNQRISFAESAAIINYIGKETLLEYATTTTMRNRINLIAYLDEKWGETGIIGWDLIRVAHVVSWSVSVGYIDNEEAYSLMEPAIIQLQYHFSNWDDALDNWLDGYAYWSNMDMNNPSTSFTRRHTDLNNFRTTSDLYVRLRTLEAAGANIESHIERLNELDRFYYRFPNLLDNSLFSNPPIIDLQFTD